MSSRFVSAGLSAPPLTSVPESVTARRIFLRMTSGASITAM